MYRLNNLVRSLLFTPADRKSALEKAWSNTNLDVLIIDMEDAVAGTSSAKNLARHNLEWFMREKSSPINSRIKNCQPNIVVRINCPTTSLFGVDDLALLEDLPNVDAVLIPKTECVNNIVAIAKRIKTAKIWCMIETPKGN